MTSPWLTLGVAICALVQLTPAPRLRPFTGGNRYLIPTTTTGYYNNGYYNNGYYTNNANTGVFDDTTACQGLSGSTGYPAAVGGPGLCYLAVSKHMSWQQAVEECRVVYGGRLAIIDNTEKLDIVYDMYKNASGLVDEKMRMWVGLYQLNNNDEPAGNWFWVDADGVTLLSSASPYPASQSPWHPFEPNDRHANQQCGNVWQQAFGKGREGFGLEDVPCNAVLVLEYICEVKV